MAEKIITLPALGRTVERLRTQNGTTVRVVQKGQTLPTGLPAGSIAIQDTGAGLAIYVEDGKTA